MDAIRGLCVRNGDGCSAISSKVYSVHGDNEKEKRMQSVKLLYSQSKIVKIDIVLRHGGNSLFTFITQLMLKAHVYLHCGM